MFSLKPKSEKGCDITSQPKGHDCCSVQPKGKALCPSCHTKAKGVLAKTLEHLLIDKTKEKLTSLEGFYFCKTPSCKVVYFKDAIQLTQKDIMVVVGHKEGATPATVCYCFNWTKEKIQAQLDETGKSTALKEIKEKMKNPGCACEILNPSGGCCLGDVSKVIKELQSS